MESWFNTPKFLRYVTLLLLPSRIGICFLSLEPGFTSWLALTNKMWQEWWCVSSGASFLQRPYGFCLWNTALRPPCKEVCWWMKPLGEGRSPSQQPALTARCTSEVTGFSCSAALWAECSHVNEPRWKQQKTLPANPQNHGVKIVLKCFFKPLNLGGDLLCIKITDFWGFPAVLRIKIICWSPYKAKHALKPPSLTFCLPFFFRHSAFGDLWLVCLFPPQGFPVCCSPNLAFTLATPTHPSALFAASPCQILTVHSGNTSAFLWTSDNQSLCVCLGVTLPSPSVNSTKVAEPGFVHHCVPVLYHSRAQ